MLAASIAAALLLALPVQDGYAVAVVRFPDGAEVLCQIADTLPKRLAGLSRHESLQHDRGMIFVYSRDRFFSFWMPPEMNFSIDLIFLDENFRIIDIAHDAPPCSDPQGYDCPNYGPQDRPGRYVVEVVAGFCAEHALQPGDTLCVCFPEGFSLPSSDW